LAEYVLQHGGLLGPERLIGAQRITTNRGDRPLHRLGNLCAVGCHAPTNLMLQPLLRRSVEGGQLVQRIGNQFQPIDIRGNLGRQSFELTIDLLLDQRLHCVLVNVHDVFSNLNGDD
jgi:hypothetical protein